MLSGRSTQVRESIIENPMEQLDDIEIEIQEDENDISVDEIDGIMQNASLHHSISKIGRSPIGRAGNPANFANDSVVSNYLSLLAGG